MQTIDQLLVRAVWKALGAQADQGFVAAAREALIRLRCSGLSSLAVHAALAERGGDRDPARVGQVLAGLILGEGRTMMDLLDVARGAPSGQRKRRRDPGPSVAAKDEGAAAPLPPTVESLARQTALAERAERALGWLIELAALPRPAMDVGVP